MQIKRIRIQGLRSIRDVDLEFDAVTAIIGGNNAGKSTILKALELFFDASPKLKDEDFHERQADEIIIDLEFCNLTPQELEEFGSAVVDGSLRLRRALSSDADRNLQYSARAYAFPGFEEIRATISKPEQRKKFNALAQELDGLDTAANADQVQARMKAWEAANPDRLELTYLRGFFGIPNVANGKLRKKTSLHLVPAVADAAEETDSQKKSPIIKLLSDISRQIYENKEDVKEFLERAEGEFSKLVDPSNMQEISGISSSLTASLGQYYSGSKLLANWEVDDAISVAFPRPTIKVEDQGFQTVLENVGHGLQRACLFAIIQFLAESASRVEGGGFKEAQSDILLLIEEPEIYQHPLKQEVISNAFHKICSGFSEATGIRLQIIFTTHSEKFVGFKQFQSARILRRNDQTDGKSHIAEKVSISECSKYFAALIGVDPMSNAAFEAKLHIFSREICEGFFSDKVILVEGSTDKHVLEGYFKSKGRDNIKEGISIIAVDGKTKLDKPFYIFSQLGISTYMIFDADYKEKEKEKLKESKKNRLLQAVAGAEDVDDFPNGVFARYAAFEHDLETYLRKQSGDCYENIFGQIADFYGLDVSDLSKTPGAVAEVVVRCIEAGCNYQQLDEVIAAVDGL